MKKSPEEDLKVFYFNGALRAGFQAILMRPPQTVKTPMLFKKHRGFLFSQTRRSKHFHAKNDVVGNAHPTWLGARKSSIDCGNTTNLVLKIGDRFYKSST